MKSSHRYSKYLKFDFFVSRNSVHLAQLTDAVHILSSNRISMSNVEKAKQLLISFAENFELLYGEKNAVFNVHVVRHLADCVKFIGPLFAYSNYCFEDHIGHLVSLQKGTTDVATQISSRYLLEKNILHSIEQSTTAKEFFEEINGNHKFHISRRVSGSLVIGNAKKLSQLTEDERTLIIDILNIAKDTKIDEYNSVLLDCKVFYEANSCKKKRTKDSFILNTRSGNFADIKSIFVINEKLYFLVNEMYDKKIDTTNKCHFIKQISLADLVNQRVIASKYIGPKYMLVRFNQMIACSKIPNMYERN